MNGVKMGKVLIFHNTIAPYRIDFFNDLYRILGAKICLYYENLKDQTFDYEVIKRKLLFKPEYLGKHIRIGKKERYFGHLKIIKRENPDIVITSEFGEGLWASAFARFVLRKKYRIITICDDSLDYATGRKGVRRLIRDVAIKILDGMILCNDDAEKWYDSGYRLKTTVFPIIANEKIFRSDMGAYKDAVASIIRDNKLTGKRIFLFVGRIAPEKNIRYLVDSFIRQHDQNPENLLLIIGGATGSNEPLLDEILGVIKGVKAEGYIKYLGRKEGDELKAYYYASGVFVLPSVSEPFGAVVNEALMCGNYVMVSSHAGSAFLINGENGEVIDVSSPFIDFSGVSKKIQVCDGVYHERECSMPFSYEDRMTDLIKWIGSI